MPVIPALKRLRPEDHTFEDSRDYTKRPLFPKQNRSIKVTKRRLKQNLTTLWAYFLLTDILKTAPIREYMLTRTLCSLTGFFLMGGGLSSGLHTCEALKSHLQSILLWLFWRQSLELYAWAGLEP
jgi:hypothetical protein